MIVWYYLSAGHPLDGRMGIAADRAQAVAQCGEGASIDHIYEWYSTEYPDLDGWRWPYAEDAQHPVTLELGRRLVAFGVAEGRVYHQETFDASGRCVARRIGARGSDWARLPEGIILGVTIYIPPKTPIEAIW